MQEPAAQSDQYLPSLDGWRAIAIILVILSHWWASDGGQAIAGHHLTSQGDLGVRIFFVISGFLITLLLLREFLEFGNISFGQFYARRALRIFPVYFAFLSVLVILTLAGLYQDAASSWLGSRPSAAATSSSPTARCASCKRIAGPATSDSSGR